MTEVHLTHRNGPCEGRKRHGTCKCPGYVPGPLQGHFRVCARAECGHTRNVHAIVDGPARVDPALAPIEEPPTKPRGNVKTTTKAETRPTNTQEDDMAEATTTKKTTAEPKGTAWLVDHVNEKLGTALTGYQLRIVIRKLTKDGTLERGEGRYEFKGVNDPQVKAVVAAVKAGAVEETKAAKITEAKSTAASKKAASKPAAETSAKAARKRAAKPKPAEEPVAEDDLDLEEL